VTGSTGSVDARPADVLVVRCEGPGPALDASSVRLQPDGRLRYEATNVADAEWVMFEGEDPMHVMHDNKGGQPFDTTTVTGSMKGFAPGTYWVGCRVIDASGGIPESHLDHPEAYTSFEVLPADADA
jgi:hypothetical protein